MEIVGSFVEGMMDMLHLGILSIVLWSMTQYHLNCTKIMSTNYHSENINVYRDDDSMGFGSDELIEDSSTIIHLTCYI